MRGRVALLRRGEVGGGANADRVVASRRKVVRKPGRVTSDSKNENSVAVVKVTTSVRVRPGEETQGSLSAGAGSARR